MITMKIEKSYYEEYPERFHIRIHATKPKESEYIKYEFIFDRPAAIKTILDDTKFAEYIGEVIEDTLITVMCKVIVYTFDYNGNEVFLYELSEDVILNSDNIPCKALNAEIIIPEDIVYELPYYVPILCKVSGGVAPYTYQWIIDNSVKEYQYTSFIKDNLCSMVFLEKGNFIFSCTVTDAVGNIVTVFKDYLAAPIPIIVNYEFDKYPSPDEYDKQYEIYAQLYSPPENSKTINYYVGIYNMIIDLNDAQLENLKIKMISLINKTVNEALMYWRYNSSFTCYSSFDHRVDIYRPTKISLHNIFKHTDNRIGFHFKITNDYGLSTAVARIFQMLRWVCYMEGYTYTILDFNIQNYSAPLLAYDEIMDDMLGYLYNNWNKLYKNVELDELYDAVQHDVHRFLGLEHKYIGAYYSGLTNIGE